MLCSNLYYNCFSYRCIKNDIAIYSPHTACDAAYGGVNDWIVKGLGDVWSSSPISPREDDCRTGIGRIAVLSEPYPSLQTIVDRMKIHFGIKHLQLAVFAFNSYYYRQMLLFPPLFAVLVFAQVRVILFYQFFLFHFNYL